MITEAVKKEKERISIHVFRIDESYGDGLIFIKARNKEEAQRKLETSIHRSYAWEYIGTIRDLVKQIKNDPNDIVPMFWVE